MTILLALVLLIPTITFAKDPSQPAITLQETKPLRPRDKRKARKERAKEQKKKQQEEAKKNARKTLKQMNFDELKASKERLLQAGDKETASKYLEKMLPIANDLNERRDITLELADVYFDIGELEKAGKMYKEFSTMYPSSSKVEFAAYKSVLCSFYATLDEERDQTKTGETIELANNFLERAQVFTTYSKDVREILTNCRKKLFDSEVSILNGQINRGRFLSAKTRLANIRKDFLTELPQVEPQLLVLECNLAERQNNKELLAQKQTELVTKFPEFQLQLAQAQPKRRFLSRF